VVFEEGKEYILGADMPFDLGDAFVNDMHVAVLIGDYKFLKRDPHFSPAQIRARVQQKEVRKTRQRHLRKKVYEDGFFVRKHGIG
jgi:hypothetical protein